MQPTYSNPYNFFPNLYRDFKGKKYSYSGRFKRDTQLMSDLKRTLFRNGFYTKIQPSGSEFILWCRKR